ncbi:hypothetical protein B7463_g6481, partial [Scytalidium lignicola]
MSDDSGFIAPRRTNDLKGAENYDLWSSRVMLLLKSKALEDHVNGLSSIPKTTEDVASAESKAWRKDDAKAHMSINVNIDDEAVLLVKDCPTAKDSWDSLKAQYKGK